MLPTLFVSHGAPTFAVEPGVIGPNPSRYCSSVEKLTMVMVRPWKLFAQQTISASPGGMPFTV